MTAIVNEQQNLAGEIRIARMFMKASIKKREASPKRTMARGLFDYSGSRAIILPPKVVGFGFSMGADLNMAMRPPVLPLEDPRVAAVSGVLSRSALSSPDLTGLNFPRKLPPLPLSFAGSCFCRYSC